LIEILSLLLAATSLVVLLVGAVSRRRFAEKVARLARAAERLADTERLARVGRAGAGLAGETPSTLTPAAAPVDLDAALARIERALDRLAVRLELDVAAVETERRKLDEILAGVPEGVLVTGPDRVPIYANRAFRELFDVDRAASTQELLALVRRPQVHAVLDGATRGESGAPVELQIGGREISVLARRLEPATRAPTGPGLTGILLMARDVSESNRLARMRRDFVTNLSHEIKTPLAIIRGAAETIEATAADDPLAAERFVRRIIEQIYRLEDLLKDLLTLARLESAEATAQRQPVELGAICRRAVELLSPLATREGVALRVRAEEVPAISADAKALERLVQNLLVNGIQYNREGGWVELRLLPEDDRVVLEVEDDGIGIPEAELDRIFERFYRVDKGRGRGEGGSGLGLAIVKHVAQAHGGSVEVRSQRERGSLFRVVLPVAGAVRAGARDAPAAARDADAGTAVEVRELPAPSSRPS
jgi:two-component system phosphate regulon sensor histidine kinase PhoR